MRQEIADPHELRVRDRADARAADDFAADRARMAAQRLRAGDDALGVGQELAPGRRQHHAARRPLEQRDAELVLQRLDLRADGRLADVQLLGGPRQLAEFGDRRKAAQLVELHGWARDLDLRH